MATQFVWNGIRWKFRKFLTDRGANVSVIFALTLVPVAGGVATAVDYSRASSARTAMQNVLDSTALMVGKDAKLLSASEIQSRSHNIFTSMYVRSDVSNVLVNASFNPETGQLKLTSSGTLTARLAGVIGISQVKIGARSEIATAGANLEIALVLDNTGSMGSAGKIQSLKAAAKMFIGDLKKTSKKPGDIKVSIVPFDTRVKIPAAFKKSWWIDWGEMNSTERANWDGCVADRDKYYDVNDTAPNGNPGTEYPADGRSCALPEILPLTTDFALATSRLDQMSPEGKTNTTIGLVWGWHALSPGAPLTEAAKPSADVAKFIVFLTDGQNTENRWTSNTHDIDGRTEKVCANLRSSGIKVFTIRVKEGNEELLRNCATEPNMYYDVPAVSEMMAVFKSISRSISKLRIAK
jgi:Mg-chelatase subunit ChlD